MATKSDFDEHEWEAIQKGLTGAGMLVSVADRDFTDSFGEARALAKYVTDEHQHGGSALVRDIAAVHGTGFGFRTTPEKLESEALDALRSATQAIAAKAPEEVEPYRELVLGAAQHVADAKGGGTSEAEGAAIAKIRDALGATGGASS